MMYILKKFKISKKWVYIIIDSLLISFMFITNFTPSVTRACLMGIIGITSDLFYKKLDTLNSIFISMLVLLIINPYIVNDIGFELSYSGTIGIVLFKQKINLILSRKINKKISNILSVSISAQIMIIPIIMYKLNSLSMIFPLSNLLATPLLGIIIILGFITISISFLSFKLAKFLAILLNLFLEILNQIAKMTSKIPYSNLTISTPNIFSIILIYFMFFSIYFITSVYSILKIQKIYENKKRIFKLIAILIVIITVFTNLYVPIKKELKIYFIDVGQGDSTLVITPKNKKILIDGGEGRNNTLNSYLLDRRIKKLDYIIISHFDSDHVRRNSKSNRRV